MTADESLDARVTALEESVADLRERLDTAVNRDIPLLKGTVRGILTVDIDTIDELPAAGSELGVQLAEVDDRLAQVEARLEVIRQHTDASTKAEKVATVVAFAQNKAGTNGKVAVTPAEIRGCTGVSRRYAYDLVEEMAREFDGMQVRDAGAGSVGTGAGKQKALLVDCEQVHELSAAVNRFTTAKNGADNQQADPTLTEER